MPPVLLVSPKPEASSPKHNLSISMLGFCNNPIGIGEQGKGMKYLCIHEVTPHKCIPCHHRWFQHAFKVKSRSFLSSLTVQLQPCIKSARSDESSALNTCDSHLAFLLEGDLPRCTQVSWLHLLEGDAEFVWTHKKSTQHTIRPHQSHFSIPSNKLKVSETRPKVTSVISYSEGPEPTQDLHMRLLPVKWNISFNPVTKKKQKTCLAQ